MRCGPYIGDHAVADSIKDTISKNNEPLFIFAITMECHGPYTLENIDEQQIIDEFIKGDCPYASDLLVYLSHLQHTDQMIGSLNSYLANINRPVLFCLYGDHMPSLYDLDLYSSFKYPMSNYFINNYKGCAAENKEISIHELFKYATNSIGLSLIRS